VYITFEELAQYAQNVGRPILFLRWGWGYVVSYVGSDTRRKNRQVFNKIGLEPIQQYIDRQQ
jgi:hypothetical protein